MDKRRVTPLSRDKSARLLFMAVWIAPICFPMMAAAASPWLAHQPPQRTVRMPLRNASQMREPIRVETRLDEKQASDRRTEMRAMRDLIPGSPVILAAGFEGGAVAGKTAAGHPVRRMLGDHVLRDVEVTADMRLRASGVIVGLAGVVPLEPSAECRRLDGVVELCATRVTSRLEILTRGRPVTCHFGDAPATNEFQGVCRAGRIDIADDLVRNGLARRVGSS